MFEKNENKVVMLNNMQFDLDSLDSMKRVCLTKIAKILKIKGWYNMNKPKLIASIREACKHFNNNNENEEEKELSNNMVSNNESRSMNANQNEKEYATQITRENVDIPKKDRNEYIDAIEVGIIIAFALSENKAMSAKVENIKKENGKVVQVVCVAKDNKKYKVPREAILWVKTGARWPKGVYEKFKAINDD